MKKKYIILSLVLLLIGCKSKTYTVTFVDNDKELSSVIVKEGENIKSVENPTKNGYIFVSWLKDGVEYNTSNPINEDITLTASWTALPNVIENHTITFDFGDFTKTKTVKDGEKVTKPEEEPKKEKHTFLGWYVGESEYNFDKPVTKDIIITAKFKRNRIKISYDLNGGTGTVEMEIDKGTTPERPKNPTKFGYNFVGWTLDGQQYNFDFPLETDTVIKALWEATVYVRVTYDTDGGNEINSEMVPQNTTLSKLPTPIKEDYEFTCWFLDDTCFDIDMKITKDITLIAKYKEKANENEQ